MPILLLVLLYYKVRLMAWFRFGAQSKVQKLERDLEWHRHSFAQITKEASQLRQTNGRMTAAVHDLERSNAMLKSVADKRLGSITDMEQQINDLEAALSTSKLECEAADILLATDRDKLRQVQAELDDRTQENERLSKALEALLIENQSLQQEYIRVAKNSTTESKSPVKGRKTKKK